ncbi:hypothetical protein BDW62DRAFT_212725 [Aspergillus aurantiobrunneus]
MVQQTLTGFLLYLAHHSQTPYFWPKVLVAGLILTAALPTISLLTMLTRVLCVPRTLTSLSTKTQTIIGRPLFFPVTLTHMRLTPVKDKFLNQFLLIGVPVGLRCRIGNLLAVDDTSLDVSPPPADTGFSWKRALAHLSCWFSVDAVRVLHRGDHGLDLREKLDRFLRAEGEDPAQWPYAYLLSVPKFMGFSRNVVSWWYLYRADRELDALILEINNSYNEKRNILLRVRPASDSVNGHQEPAGHNEYIDDRRLIHSIPSAPRSKFYTGNWNKHIFASPFEKVDGVVSQRVTDPLQAVSWAPNASFSNMTTLEESGQVRMVTRLTCAEPPIDPTAMSSWGVVKLLFRWTIPGIMATPSIILKALKIRFSGAMHMNPKPPVRGGSIARHITRLEMDLEPFFRAYLAHHVQAHPNPIELTYHPCRSFTNETIHLRSPSSYGKPPCSIRRITIEPTDPAFYTRVTHYPDIKTALLHETQQTGDTADPTAQRLLVSDLTFLISILKCVCPECDPCIQPRPKLNPKQWKSQTLLRLVRGSTAPSFMGEFVLAVVDPSYRAVYVSSVVRLSAARRLAFSSQGLLRVYVFLASCLLRWVALEAVLGVSWDVAVYSGLHKFSFWTTGSLGLLGYVAILRVLSIIKTWLLR